MREVLRPRMLDMAIAVCLDQYMPGNVKNAVLVSLRGMLTAFCGQEHLAVSIFK